MALVLAVASPKGGVGKTVSAVNLAVLAARVMKLHVMLTDTDENRCAIDWAAKATDDQMPFDVSYGAEDPDSVVQLRDADYDLVVLDLAGARTGHFQTLLKPRSDGEPAVDFLLIPTKSELMDIRPVARVVQDEIVPLSLPYMMVLTKVDPRSMPRPEARANGALSRAEVRRNELRGAGFNVADVIIREYSTHNEASESHTTVLDLPGKHSKARSAERDYARLASEVFDPMGLDTEPLEELARWHES